MSASPTHPFVGPGSICLLCQARVALPYGHLCRLCDTTLADEAPPSRCVAPLRCYCLAHLGRVKAPPKAESIQEAHDVLAERRALAAAGYTRDQRTRIALADRERNAGK